MKIAFKGKVIYTDNLERDAKSPLTFTEMIKNLNENNKFDFLLEEGTNETVLTITRRK